MSPTDETPEEAQTADATRVVAELERCARPHEVRMPSGRRIACASYQEAWLRRNAEAWAAGYAPHDVAIHDENGDEVK